MKAVVSVFGKDRSGIIAAVSAALAERNINIEDISQTIMHGNFVMSMLVDLAESKTELSALGAELSALANRLCVTIHVQHEDLFKAMQRV